jgi:hypothetical protein
MLLTPSLIVIERRNMETSRHDARDLLIEAKEVVG